MTLKKSRLQHVLALWGMFAFIAFFVTGCGSAPVAPPAEKTDPAKDYAREKENLETTKVISPGFMLSIEHSADESISGEYRVSFKGELKLPYKVKVMAAGRTTDELSKDLVHAYSGYFKSGNTVKVSIVTREYYVEIRGLVKKPGVYAVKVDTSFEETLALAGGISGVSGEGQGGPKPEYIRVVRRDFRNKDAAPRVTWIRLTDYFLKYDIKNEALWRGGEQLFLQVTGETGTGAQSQTVQVMGEVKLPGEYGIQSGAGLHTYLTRAGGVTSGADIGNVTVIHSATNSSKSYDISNSMAVVDLEPGDVILVKAVDNRPSFLEKMAPLFISAGSLILSVLIAIATL